MVNYQQMYTTMFNAATDALAILNQYIGSDCYDLIECIAILSQAQAACEDIFIETESL